MSTTETDIYNPDMTYEDNNIPQVIDLGKMEGITEESRSLLDKAIAEKIRTKIDEIILAESGANKTTDDQSEWKVNVVIPTRILSISPTFFEELFKNVIKHLGKDLFYKTVHFTNEGKYKIDADLETAVYNVLRENNMLKFKF